MFPSNQLTGFYMMRTLVVKGLNLMTTLQEDYTKKNFFIFLQHILLEHL